MDMALIVKALQGDVRAYKEIMDRLKGSISKSEEIHGTKTITVRYLSKDLALKATTQGLRKNYYVYLS